MQGAINKQARLHPEADLLKMFIKFVAYAIDREGIYLFVPL